VEGGPVKRVEHHGVVSFRIPKTWIEEHEENTGIYYENDNGTGTLRLTVMTARRPQANTAGGLVEFMRGIQGREGGKLQLLANGNVVWRNTVGSIEDGQELTEHHWEIGSSISPTQFRLAIFTFTLVSARIFDERNVGHVTMLDEELPNTQFLGLSDTPLY
jgi:hypothetical protein